MFRSLLLITSLFASSLCANQITIRVTIAPHANTQMKMTHVDALSIKQDIFLKTNHQGFSIALTEDIYGQSNFINGQRLTLAPLSLSDNIHKIPTKVGELVISQKENKGSLGITISVK
jgi:hypothetical protein